MKLKSVLLATLLVSGAYSANWDDYKESYYSTGEIGIGYLKNMGDNITTKKSDNVTLSVRADEWNNFWHAGAEVILGTHALNSKDGRSLFGEAHLKPGFNIGTDETPVFLDVVVSLLKGARVDNINGSDSKYSSVFGALGAELGGKIAFPQSFIAYNLGYGYILGGGYDVPNATNNNELTRSKVNGGHLVRASVALHKKISSHYSFYGRLSARYLNTSSSKSIKVSSSDFSVPSHHNVSAMLEVGFGF